MSGQHLAMLWCLLMIGVALLGWAIEHRVRRPRKNRYLRSHRRLLYLKHERLPAPSEGAVVSNWGNSSLKVEAHS